MFLNEGGSAPGVGPIHKDEIEATLAPLGKALGVNLIDNMLGSAGKKQFSGDIDVAVQINPDDIGVFGKKVQESPLTLYFAKTSVFITKVKIQDYDPKREEIDPNTGESKGVPSGRTGYVQVDYMPGDPGWMKTYYHSPSETESKYKGVYRNIMIATMCALWERESSEERTADDRAMEVTRWIWSPSKGLVRIKRVPKPRADGNGYTKAHIDTDLQKPITNPDQIAKALGLNSGADLHSFETIHKAIKKNYKPELYQKIIDSFAKNGVVKDIGVPDEIKNKVTKDDKELDRIKQLAGV
tara:strand:- start:398 stop:1291 length:894 start_codon:yes stop_codon:yes gene_type:complete